MEIVKFIKEIKERKNMPATKKLVDSRKESIKTSSILIRKDEKKCASQIKMSEGSSVICESSCKCLNMREKENEKSIHADDVAMDVID